MNEWGRIDSFVRRVVLILGGCGVRELFGSNYDEIVPFSCRRARVHTGRTMIRWRDRKGGRTDAGAWRIEAQSPRYIVSQKEDEDVQRRGDGGYDRRSVEGKKGECGGGGREDIM
jgi:hypothetical protein